jgi:hypothetical protein
MYEPRPRKSPAPKIGVAVALRPSVLVLGRSGPFLAVWGGFPGGAQLFYEKRDGLNQRGALIGAQEHSRNAAMRKELVRYALRFPVLEPLQVKAVCSSLSGLSDRLELIFETTPTAWRRPGGHLTAPAGAS